MRKSPRLAVLAALAVVVAFASCLILAYRYGATDKALSREFDLAIKKREAILTADARRPVLRGKPTPGDGGYLLEKALLDLDRQAMQVSIHAYFLLYHLLEDGGDPEEVDAAKRAFDEMRVCLPDVREAIQHESCRIPQDADRSFWEQFPVHGWPTIALVGRLLLLEADLEAGQGDLRGALTRISDTIRYGHDLKRVAPDLTLWLVALNQEAGATRKACTLLSSSSPTQEELGPFLEELSILDRTRPSFRVLLEWEEGEEIMDLVRWVRGESERYCPRPLWGEEYMEMVGLDYMDYFEARRGAQKEYIRLVGVDFEEYHRVWRGIREAHTLSVPEMRKMSVQLEAAAEKCGGTRPPRVRGLLELDLKSRTLLACIRAAVMVHLYRAGHDGAWPEGLASIGEIPLDPWDGEPLRFRPPDEDRPAVIYSVGANLVDDGGRASGPFGFEAEGGDLDFLLPLGPWPGEDQASRRPR